MAFWHNPLTRAANFAALGCLFSMALGTPTASAVVKPGIPEIGFPVAPQIAKRVWFWEGVFSRYPSSTVLIHDTDNPELIVDVLDFKVINSRNGRNLDRRDKDRLIQRYLDRYHLAIQRFKQHGEDATKFGSIEERIYSVYSRNDRALVDLYNGKSLMRSQQGLADEFAKAAQRASGYLPQMEKIFLSYNLPRDLTRLPFVESMFTTGAISKVGATGIWQFMPYTAKTYMLVNSYIDERNAPFKATRAAARLLADNFSELRSWPLAITAYNHGRAGMAKAARSTGTNDLGAIVENFDGPSFGFASKNFYSEFIAARNVYNKHFENRLSHSKSNELTPITLRKRISISQLVRFTPLDTQTLQKHNPCLLPRAYSAYRYQPLPANYEIFVPNNLARDVKVALDRIKAQVYTARK